MSVAVVRPAPLPETPPANTAASATSNSGPAPKRAYLPRLAGRGGGVRRLVIAGSAQLVHLSRNRLNSADAEKGQDKRYHVENDLMVVAVERGWLQDRLERDITFERFGKSEEMWLPCACPK